MLKLTIEHEKVGMRCFSRVQFKKTMLMRYYTGTLMYVNMYGDKYLDRSYE